MRITELIGNTPLVKLNSYSTGQVSIYAKLEGQNPGGSIKDRVALALIEDLEARYPDLKDKIIIEPSSGNTGIGLAMISAAKGYRVKIVMPESATAERVKMLKAYGAEVEFCSKEDWKGQAAIEKVKQLVENDAQYVMPNQYENPVCVDVHYRTTAAEILAQCPDITHLVACLGTGGTATGIGKRLKEHNPTIQVVGVEIGADSRIPGPRNLQQYIPPIIDFEVINKRVMIEDEPAVFSMWKELSAQLGIFAGPSSAAALLVARQISDSLDSLCNIVVIFPDRGDKYVSIL